MNFQTSSIRTLLIFLMMALPVCNHPSAVETDSKNTSESRHPSGVRPGGFEDISEAVGLDGITTGKVRFVDLNKDDRPDLVVDGDRVFMNRKNTDTEYGFRFEEIEEPGLPAAPDGANTVFADLNGNGMVDALRTERWKPSEGDGDREGKRTRWFPGNGDGTFQTKPRIVKAASPADTISVAVGDRNLDGHLDLVLGHNYNPEDPPLQAYQPDLLINEGNGTFKRVDRIAPFDRDPLWPPPLYGVMFMRLIDPFESPAPDLFTMSYGRRWNLLYPGEQTDGPVPNISHRVGLDGDAVRHGRYPDWFHEFQKNRGQDPRPDEDPFRANGNTFDTSVADVNRDGRFDLFVSEITHAWAGHSSDRSRFLFQAERGEGSSWFYTPPGTRVDRIPPVPPRSAWPDDWFPSWNQGDLFCDLVDLNNNGRIDLLLSSGDYPDNQRLRTYMHQSDGTFVNRTHAMGIDHDGSQMISTADVNGDGRMDVVAGQSFFRYPEEMKEGRKPELGLFLNRNAPEQNALVIRPEGNPEKGVNPHGLGTIIKVTAHIDGEEVTQMRQLVGIGGHRGKQHDFALHFGLGDAHKAQRVKIYWPTKNRDPTVLKDVPAGAHVVTPDE